jgi:hypothetical protein
MADKLFIVGQEEMNERQINNMNAIYKKKNDTRTSNKDIFIITNIFRKRQKERTPIGSCHAL